jgi:hypothetical protein
MAQGPIGAILYQPVQPRVGEGEAQVFSAPKTERVVDFMRREAAQVRKEERAQFRKERDELFDAIDTSLIATESLDVADRDAELYGKKYEELVNTTASLVEDFEAGGSRAVEARMKVTKEAAKLKRFADQSLNYAKKMKLWKDDADENPWKYDQSTINKWKEIMNTPGMVVPDALLLPDNTANLTGEIDEKWNKLPDDIKEGFFSQDARYSIAGNMQMTTREADTEAIIDWLSETIKNDPVLYATAAGRYKEDILNEGMTREEAVDRTIRQEAARFASLRLGDSRTKQQPRTGKGSGKVTPEQVQEAVNVKQAVREYTGIRNFEPLRGYVEGLGWNVDIVSEDKGKYQEGDLMFYKMSMSGEGANAKPSKTSITYVDRDNDDGIINQIAKMDPNITMDMIQAVPDIPKGDLDAEVAKLKAEGFGPKPKTGQEYELNGISYTVKELRDAGWSDEQIKSLGK